MNKSKQIISLFLSFIMILTVFVGCSSDEPDEPTKKKHKEKSSVSNENYDSDEDDYTEDFTYGYDEDDIDRPISSTVSGPILPSPDAYFNNRLARNEDQYSEDSGHCLSFVTDYNGQQAFFDYVELLSDPKYNLELTNTTDEVLYTLLEYTYCFTYTGAEEITDVNNKTFDEDGNDVPISGDLIVYIQKNGSAGTVMLAMYYPENSFEFKDLGDRTTYTIADLGRNSGSNSDSNNNSGSNSGSNSNYGSALECTACNGSGKCQTCGGDGLVWSSATDSERRDCNKCLFNKGKCSTCGGTGKR